VTVAAALNVVTVDVGLRELVAELVRREVGEVVDLVTIVVSCLLKFKSKAAAVQSKKVRPESRYMMAFAVCLHQAGVPHLISK